MLLENNFVSMQLYSGCLLHILCHLHWTVNPYGQGPHAILSCGPIVTEHNEGVLYARGIRFHLCGLKDRRTDRHLCNKYVLSA